MYRKIISIALIIALALSFTTTVTAATTNTPTTQDQKANALKDLGLFVGTNNGFELDRAPNRIEAVIMLLRMLGKEQEALNSTYTYPFKDVPSWSSKYVAYAYTKGLTSGISTTAFGSNDSTTPEQFLTFTLRALEYSDKNGDFTYKEAIKKAEEVGLVEAGKYKTGSKDFTRGDCVDIIYKALTITKKVEQIPLSDSLVNGKVIDASKAESYGLYAPKPKDQKVRVSLRKDPVNGEDTFYCADALSAIPNSKYVYFFWTDGYDLDDYKGIYIPPIYNDMKGPNKPTDRLENPMYNHTSITYSAKYFSANWEKTQLVVLVLDESGNMLAASINMGSDVAANGYIDFTLVNISMKELFSN